MFRAVKENIELRKEIQRQDKEYNLLLAKYGVLEKENQDLKREIEDLTRANDRHIKRIKEMRKELKELKNEKNN